MAFSKPIQMTKPNARSYHKQSRASRRRRSRSCSPRSTRSRPSRPLGGLSLAGKTTGLAATPIDKRGQSSTKMAAMIRVVGPLPSFAGRFVSYISHQMASNRAPGSNCVLIGWTMFVLVRSCTNISTSSNELSSFKHCFVR